MTDEQRVVLKRLRWTLFVIAAITVLMGGIAEAVAFRHGVRDYNDVTMFFSLSFEENFPTWYSSSLLLGCAVLLGFIATHQRRNKAPFQLQWWLLSLIFIYISLDETATIHENTGGLFHTRGLLYFDWVIPASIVVLILGLYYLRFVFSLPKRTRNGVILAGCIYVGGALVMELPLGWWKDHYGSENLTYGLIDLVEEGMEIFGITIFFIVLAEFLAPVVMRRLRLAEPSRTASPPGKGS